ncbi:unnamed protein product [Fusarium graminearum]|nr:unnamed protein product [Fusarium graminearum]
MTTMAAVTCTTSSMEGNLVLIERILRDKDYCPSRSEVEEMGLESDESDGEDQYPRKRRRISRSPTGLLRNATAINYGGKYAQASGILSPASSQATPDETEVRAALASFVQWPLENASLERMTENRKTTFQLQRGAGPTVIQLRKPAKYTPQENDLLIELKKGSEVLVWPEIHQWFTEAYPERSAESRQVHYSTKLKSRERL